jgi:hypothetical protein
MVQEAGVYAHSWCGNISGLSTVPSLAASDEPKKEAMLAKTKREEPRKREGCI